MQIALLLPPDHPWREQLPVDAQVTDLADPHDLVPLSRAPCDLLVADVALLTGHEDDVRRYRVARPTVRIVVGHPEALQPGDPTMAALVAMGVYDLVPQDAPLAETLASVRTYADAARWHTDGLPPANAGRPTPHRGPEHSMPSVTVEVPRVLDPQFFVVWGPGPAGKTAFVASLAALAAKHLGQAKGRARVLALDLDLEGGHIGTFLGLPPDAEGVASLPPYFEAEALPGYAVSAWGLDVLPAGPFASRGRLAERLDSEEKAEAFVVDLLAKAQAAYPMVLVDVPGELAHPATYAALRNARGVFLVVEQGRAALREVMELLQLLPEYGINRAKFRLVVNRHVDAPPDLAEIEEACAEFGLRPAAVLPEDRRGHLKAEYTGRPYALDHSEGWEAVLEAFTGMPVAKATGKTRGWKGVFGRGKASARIPD